MLIIPFWFVAACVFSLPVFFALLWFRHHISRNTARCSIAGSFAMSTAYMLWRTEWYDVWRHGIPSLSYLVGYVPYIAAFAAVGWLLAGAFFRHDTRARV